MRAAMAEFQDEYLRALDTLKTASDDGIFETQHHDAYREIVALEPADGTLRSIETILVDVEARQTVVDLVRHKWYDEADLANRLNVDRAYLLTVEDLMDEILHGVASGTRLLERRRKARDRDTSR